ncbi:uncharacterized protein LOC106172604 isoform X3 [Lingula anatina]|uniref:Uncharacterized protein LOC106172604 isoform X3 n=2 Tax=Lingula anatina TaxID=7574 RepID=A0A1S3JEK4_LINAN|nr:uncharacterized protein LOC106172604 isoform X3 [Lingula anatina]|eukprot:XP_013408842.1 uncharacterized protein LOC106172604 isoform X3 [Lingula anatina]
MISQRNILSKVKKRKWLNRFWKMKQELVINKMKMMAVRSKRGPYKRYNSEMDIPRRTAYREKKQLCLDGTSDEILAQKSGNGTRQDEKEDDQYYCQSMKKRGPYKRYNSEMDIPRRTAYREKKQLCLDGTSDEVLSADLYLDAPDGPLFSGEIIPETSADQQEKFEDLTETSMHMSNEESCHDEVADQVLVHEVYYSEGPDASLSGENETRQDENEDGQDYFTRDCDNIQQEEHDDDPRGWNIRDGNDPLYTGATLSKAQGLLLIVAFILRHNLTDAALNDMLSILGVLLPNAFPATKYKFYKAFCNGETQVHFYCPSCTSYLGREKARQICGSCGEAFDGEQAIKDGTFFLYIPIKEQLLDILRNDKLSRHLTNRNIEKLSAASAITDITNSHLYKSLIQKHKLTGNDLTLTWNSDGIPIFKSSGYQIWPVQCFVNELPPHLRSENILLTGLWFGHSKPSNMNTFLRPFIDECIHLEENTFSFQGVQRRVFPLICCADSPARALIRNCKQYNGQFGCDWCEHQGETVVTGRGPPTRYYPYREVPMRTDSKQGEYALLAEEANEAVKGVKGLSVIQQLPTFDVVNGMTPEYMHGVCQGVMRQLTSLWLDPPNHEEPYYVGRSSAAIDNRLLSISPPSEISRSPRSIKERKFWKSSEWRSLLMYGLVVFYGILPTVYHQHFFLLIYGVYCLLGESITPTTIAVADACLAKFVLQMEELYKLSACTFNVHQLTHLAHGVKMCGPLWATSAFTFESKNHDLLKLFAGTQCVPQQICSTFNLIRILPALARNCVTEDHDSDVMSLFNELTGSSPSMKSKKILDEGLFSIGKGKKTALTIAETISIMEFLNCDLNNLSAIVYHKFCMNNILFSSSQYTRAVRHNNSYVKFMGGKYGRVVGLYVVKPHCSCETDELQYCQCAVHNVVLLKELECVKRDLFRDVELGAVSEFLPEVSESNRILAISPVNIIKKCICLKLRHRLFLCELPCRFYDN